MKVADIRKMDAESRTKELYSLRREQFNLRMQQASGQLANSSQVRRVRRDIARIHTVMNEKAGKSE